MLVEAYIKTNQKPEGSSNPVKIVGHSPEGITLETPLPPGQVYIWAVTNEVHRTEKRRVLSGYNLNPPEDWDGVSTLLAEAVYEIQELPLVDIEVTNWAASVPDEQEKND